MENIIWNILIVVVVIVTLTILYFLYFRMRERFLDDCLKGRIKKEKTKQKSNKEKILKLFTKE